ncbi:class I SAM-dependent methyltransferase [Marinilabiliaceae bacterium ANBcel2]|nr:class I SAM-dependent methyltransferase [Marinilabiliaceae bacterium ANBcel2]
MNSFQTKRYLQYILKPNHFKGFGIHSPFAFNLVGNIMQQSHPYYHFKTIDAWRKALKRSKEKILIDDMGAGSLITNKKIRRVSNIVKYSSLPKKYGELIFRLLCQFNSKRIVELGTSTGISTLYLALPCSKSKVVTIEGCNNIATIAAETFKTFNISNVELLNGPFEKEFPKALNDFKEVDFIFFDGNHTKSATLNYFKEALKFKHNNSVFIFDDIHWSKEMEEAWTIICANPDVTLSLDLFRLGIVFFRKECTKEHYRVRF